MHFTQILSESGKISKSKWQMVTTRTATGDHQRPPSPPSPVNNNRQVLLSPLPSPFHSTSLLSFGKRQANEERQTTNTSLCSGVSFCGFVSCVVWVLDFVHDNFTNPCRDQML
ncbi:hypothetical protein Dimus_024941 [Dionaea muscipula]